MFDLLVTGATLVDADGETRADLAVRDGRVAARLPPGASVAARRTVAAAGCLLLPGLVDAHAHLREPGLTHKEDFDSGTRAAALGGVTTVLDMPTDAPWTTEAGDLAAKIGLAHGRLHVDVGFQVAPARDTADLDAIEDLGPVSFELFTADVPEPFLLATADDLAEALRRLAPRRTLTGVSAGDQSILVGSAARDPSGDIAAYRASRPPLAEASGIARALLAAAATGARIHVRQINSALGLDAFARLRGLADATVETTPQNLFFTAADYAGPAGAGLKASPPLRERADVEALRAGLRDGTIDIVATDHAPHSPAEKAAPARCFAEIPGGMPGLQTLLPVMLRLVAEGVIGHADLVRLCARNPAARFGLGRRKGRLEPGFDADILVVDPRRDGLIAGRHQASRAGYTPFEGWTVPGHLARVFLRGREIVTEGVIVGGPSGTALRPHGEEARCHC